MFVTSFWFDSKLLLGKAKKPASFELAVHTVFFLNILHNFFLKESFGSFQMNISTDFIPLSSLLQQGNCISEKLYVK